MLGGTLGGVLQGYSGGTRPAGWQWDAGMATPEHTPMGRGYSEWVGYYQHANDYWSKRMPIESTGEVS